MSLINCIMWWREWRKLQLLRNAMTYFLHETQKRKHCQQWLHTLARESLDIVTCTFTRWPWNVFLFSAIEVTEVETEKFCSLSHFPQARGTERSLRSWFASFSCLWQSMTVQLASCNSLFYGEALGTFLNRGTQNNETDRKTGRTRRGARARCSVDTKVLRITRVKKSKSIVNSQI